MKPEHIGIIIDGNRRWAKKRNLLPIQGHKKGLEIAKDIMIYGQEKGIGMMTFFIFSTENWKRPKNEINGLMKLIDIFFKKEFKKNKDFLFKKIKIKIIGQRDNLSDKLKKIIKEVEEKTQENDGMILNLAFNYGGKFEIVHAVQSIINKGFLSNQITEEVIQENLFIPNIDLVIRTGNEKRLSNFFIWQTAYSELFFLDKFWPDFTRKDFDDIINEFTNRHRRFGS